MSSPKANRQKIIDFVVSCLENGEQRNIILSKCVKKWQKTEKWTRTFDRILKIAHHQHKDKQDKIKEAIAKVDEQAAIDSRKKAIMSSDERKEALSKAANDLLEKINGNKKFTFFQGGKIVQSHNSDIFMLPIDTQAKILETVKGLFAELNKMEGDYSPVKVAQTDKEGNDINNIPIFLNVPVGYVFGTLPSNTDGEDEQ